MSRIITNQSQLDDFVKHYGRLLMALCWACNGKDIDQHHMNHIQDLLANRFYNEAPDPEGKASKISLEVLAEFVECPASKVVGKLNPAATGMRGIYTWRKKRRLKVNVCDLPEVVRELGELVASDGIVNDVERATLIKVGKYFGIEEAEVNNIIDLKMDGPRRRSADASAYSDWAAPATPSPTSSPPSSDGNQGTAPLAKNTDADAELSDTALGAELLNEVYSDEEDADGSPPSIYESD